jgi:hypothetical protein
MRGQLSLCPIGENDASVMRETRPDRPHPSRRRGPARRLGTGRHRSVNGNAARAVLLAPYRRKNHAVLN